MPIKKSLRKTFDDSKQKTAHFDVYNIGKNGSKIVLNIFPGTTGQAALTDIFIEGKEPDKSRVGSVENYELGADDELNGKYLDVYTAITDVSKDSNDISLDFNLQGGTIPYRYFMQRTVQEEGGSIVYKVSIFFMAK